MGVQERRQREKAKRNNQIVDAAEQVIFSKGIHKATMDDIAKQAELGKGTLYGYYKSKAEILLSINERASRKLAELFAQANRENDEGRKKVRAIGQAYIQFAHNFPGYYQFITLFEAGNVEIDAEEVAKNNYRVNCELVGAIKAGIEDGSIRKDVNPEAVAKCLWAMSTGVIQLMQVKGEILEKNHGLKEDEMFKHFFKIVEGGISI